MQSKKPYLSLPNTNMQHRKTYQQPLYGSSRLGLRRPATDVSDPELPVCTTCTYTYTLGKKVFELSNHASTSLSTDLGNVLTTLSDRRISETSGGTLVSYHAQILSSQDYYPFACLAFGEGSVMPGRSFSSEEYRWGFSGHERLDEVSGTGNTVDMGDRWLDTRLGRTSKTDRKAHNYQDISPYSYALNSPIQFIDPDGKVVVDPKTGEQVVKVDGKWQTVSGGDVSKEFIKNTQPVLDKLTSSEVGTKIYEELQAIRTIVVIDLSDKSNKKSLKKDGGNSKLRTREKKWKTGADGLYDAVVITPDLDKIGARATADGMDFEEKLIQVMSVEKDHITTREQIEKEKKYDYDLFSSPAVIEDVYGPLLNNAVKAGKSYRDEKGQTIDDSSYLPIVRVNEAYGTNIQIIDN